MSLGLSHPEHFLDDSGWAKETGMWTRVEGTTGRGVEGRWGACTGGRVWQWWGVRLRHPSSATAPAPPPGGLSRVSQPFFRFWDTSGFSTHGVFQPGLPVYGNLHLLLLVSNLIPLVKTSENSQIPPIPTSPNLWKTSCVSLPTEILLSLTFWSLYYNLFSKYGIIIPNIKTDYKKKKRLITVFQNIPSYLHSSLGTTWSPLAQQTPAPYSRWWLTIT